MVKLTLKSVYSSFKLSFNPTVAARHQAVYDDLMNEIDGLESDGEDDQGGSKPQPKPVSKPVIQNDPFNFWLI